MPTMCDTFSLPTIAKILRIKAETCRQLREQGIVLAGGDLTGLADELEDAARMVDLHIEAALAAVSCLNPDYCGIGDADTVCVNCARREP